MTTTLVRAPDAPPAPAPVPERAEPAVSSSVLHRSPLLMVAVALAGAAGMLLAALLAAVLLTRASAAEWPPEGVSLDLYLAVVLIFTTLMVAISAQWSVYAARHDDQTSLVLGLTLTVGLMVAVANGAFAALRQAGFGPADHAFGSLYFAVLGTYLVMAFGGVVEAVLALLRTIGGQVNPDHHGIVSVAAAWAVLLAVGWAGIYIVVWILK